jgi:hypothetical protein
MSEIRFFICVKWNLWNARERDNHSMDDQELSMTSGIFGSPTGSLATSALFLASSMVMGGRLLSFEAGSSPRIDADAIGQIWRPLLAKAGSLAE